jgi:hypothetical protein
MERRPYSRLAIVLLWAFVSLLRATALVLVPWMAYWHGPSTAAGSAVIAIATLAAAEWFARRIHYPNQPPPSAPPA